MSSTVTFPYKRDPFDRKEPRHNAPAFSFDTKKALSLYERKDDMIHLQQETTAQSVKMPRPQAIPALGAWVLTLTNGMTRKDYTFSVTPTVNGMVLTMSVTFEEKPDKGQYDYTLKRGTTVVSSGLAQIGQSVMKPTRVVYNENIEIKQYNG